jgi:hypothetical protein
MLHAILGESQQFRRLLVWICGEFIIEVGNFPLHENEHLFLGCRYRNRHADRAALFGAPIAHGYAMHLRSSRIGTSIIAVVACPVIACLWQISVASAVDDTRKFVDALREKRYLDTAVDYLDSLKADSQATPAIKSTVPYLQALVSIDVAAYERDPLRLDQQLLDAQTKLKEFLATNPSDELAAMARDRLANLLRFRAGNLVQRAEGTAVNGPRMKSEAQSLYKEARGLFEDSATRLRAQLDKLPKGEAQKEQREQLGGLWLGATLNASRSLFDMAILYDTTSGDRTRHLNDASEQFAKLYENYPQRLAGITARLYEGRCQLEVGEPKRALSAFNNVLADLPDGDAAFRALKTQTLRYAMAVWLEEKDYKKAADKSVSWVKTARGPELADSDWLALKLSAAMALKGLAATEDDKADEYLRDARALATEVARSKTAEFQKPANELIAQIEQQAAPASGPFAKSSTKAQIKLTADTKTTVAAAALKPDIAIDAKTFDEAHEKAAEAADEMKSGQLELNFAQQQKPPDAKQIADLKTAIDDNRAKAFAYSQKAIKLADEKSDQNKLALVRYLLCYFKYFNGEYYDAAVIGDFVAKKQPKSASARDAARVALASFDAIYREHLKAGEDTRFEADRLMELTAYIIKTWPDQPEAGVASEMLVTLYTSAGKFDEAAAALKQLPADSMARTDAELRYGQALWSKYLHDAQEARADGGPKNDLDALQKQAQGTLESGVAALKKAGNVSDRGVLGTVSLAQLYLNQSEPAKALELLEHPKIGPLTLAKARHPSTALAGVQAEIFKTALRCYVNSEPQQLQKAAAAMEALEQAYSREPEGQEKLTQMLLSIAYDLQQQLEQMGKRGDTEGQARLMRAFDKFLSRIPERAGTDFKTLSWVASTYENLADSLKDSGKLHEDADAYSRQAAKSYEQILSRAEADPKFAPADKLFGVRFHLAICYRNGGEFEKALKIFADLLKEKPTLLPIQIEAARTFQFRGTAQDKIYYVRAIEGGDKPETASIWGWGKLAVQTSRDPKFRDVFHEARYNLALSRKRFAEASAEEAKKSVALQKAKNDIQNTKNFDSTLGGQKWKPKYDALLRELQKALSQPVVGLAEFEAKPEEAKKE